MTHAPRRPLLARAARTTAATVAALALTVGGATTALADAGTSAPSASQASQASAQGDQRAERQAVLDRYLASEKGRAQVDRVLSRPGGRAKVDSFIEAYLRDGTVPAGVDLPAAPTPKPAPAPAADQGLTGPERAMFTEMNEERVSVGCEAVVADPKLTAAARYHASDMVERQYFAHTSPSGETPGDRAEKFGTTWSAENIAAGSTDGVTSAVQLWNSPGHRANISDCSHTRVGIGTDDGSVGTNSAGVPIGDGTWVQMFGR